MTHLAVGEWAVIQFGLKQFVGELLEKKDAEFRFDCLCKKNTKEFQGFIYQYPNVRDNQTWLTHSQILYHIPPPEPYRRGLFKCSVDVWN